MKNLKKLPLESIEQLHKNYSLLERFWLSDNGVGEYGQSLLEQLDSAIYQTANGDVWKEAAGLIDKLKDLVSTSMDTASNSAKHILKSA